MANDDDGSESFIRIIVCAVILDKLLVDFLHVRGNANHILVAHDAHQLQKGAGREF